MTVSVERLLLVGAMAFTLSLLLTPLARGFARRFDLVDRPGGYKAHGAATPLLGGLAVAIAFIAVAAWSTMTHAPGNMADIAAIALGAAIIVAVGLVDDVRGDGHLWNRVFRVLLVVAVLAGLIGLRGYFADQRQFAVGAGLPVSRPHCVEHLLLPLTGLVDPDLHDLDTV